MKIYYDADETEHIIRAFVYSCAQHGPFERTLPELHADRQDCPTCRRPCEKTDTQPQDQGWHYEFEQGLRFGPFATRDECVAKLRERIGRLGMGTGE